MNLLLLNWLDRENPRAGGAEIHLHENFRRLVQRGWKVTLVTSGWKGAPQRAVLDGIQVHRVGGRHTFALKALPYVRRHFGGEVFDLAIEDLNKIPLFLPLWSPAPTLLVVHHLFGRTAFESAPLPIALATWLLEKGIPRAYQGRPVIAVSESTRNDLSRRGMDPGQITVIENGVDTVHLAPGRMEDRFPEPTLLYLGRLRAYKGVDIILRAMARLRDEGATGARLLIAGKGDDETRLREIAQKLRLSDREVRFLGYVTEKEKVELLRRAWVHILASPKEGWGISIMEAAACATPSVASNAPGLRDSVRDGETGFLVPHGDIDALARKTHILLADQELRRRMGESARSFAERHSWEEGAALLARAVEEAVLKAGRRSQ